MNNYKLYVHIAPSGKRYYGITKQKPEKRWQKGLGYIDNPYFTRAIEKYGWDNITHEILQEGLTKEEAQELEKYMIQWYDTANRDYGYNLTLGGEGANGNCHSEETKQKMSENHWDCSGKNNPASRKVICLETNIIFDTFKDACKSINCAEPSLRNAIKNNRVCKGYTFVYYDDYLQSEKSNKENNQNLHATRRKIICLETKTIYGTTREAAASVNGNSAGICSSIKNNRKYKNYTFRYLNTFIII